MSNFNILTHWHVTDSMMDGPLCATLICSMVSIITNHTTLNVKNNENLLVLLVPKFVNIHVCVREKERFTNK